MQTKEHRLTFISNSKIHCDFTHIALPLYAPLFCSENQQHLTCMLIEYCTIIATTKLAHTIDYWKRKRSQLKMTYTSAPIGWFDRISSCAMQPLCSLVRPVISIKWHVPTFVYPSIAACIHFIAFGPYKQCVPSSLWNESNQIALHLSCMFNTHLQFLLRFIYIPRQRNECNFVTFERWRK